MSNSSRHSISPGTRCNPINSLTREGGPHSYLESLFKVTMWNPAVRSCPHFVSPKGIFSFGLLQINGLIFTWMHFKIFISPAHRDFCIINFVVLWIISRNKTICSPGLPTAFIEFYFCFHTHCGAPTHTHTHTHLSFSRMQLVVFQLTANRWIKTYRVVDSTTTSGVWLTLLTSTAGSNFCCLASLPSLLAFQI